MENSLIESVLNVCKILNKHSVEYLIVGGTAVALHGFFRRSQDPSGHLVEKHDLDFWYNSTYTNYFNLINALESLGQDVTEFRAEVAPNPKNHFSDWNTINSPLTSYQNYQVFQNSVLLSVKGIYQKSMKSNYLLLTTMI